mgnify:CR=1 FL=1
MKINYYLKYWLPVIFYLGIIYYFSSLANPLEQTIPIKMLTYFDFQRFVYHIIEYAILSLLIYRAFKIVSKNPQTLSILFTVIYAITDEIHQFYVPGRISSVFDVVVDAFGAIAAQCILNLYFWLKN